MVGSAPYDIISQNTTKRNRTSAGEVGGGRWSTREGDLNSTERGPGSKNKLLKSEWKIGPFLGPPSHSPSVSMSTGKLKKFYSPEMLPLFRSKNPNVLFNNARWPLTFVNYWRVRSVFDVAADHCPCLINYRLQKSL